MREYIISQLEDSDLVHLYTNLEKYLYREIITCKKTLGKESKKNPEVIWDWVSKLINNYDYYAINYNRLEERLWEQNKSNTGLENELETIKAQFEDTFNYLKKKICKIEQLETIIY